MIKIKEIIIFTVVNLALTLTIAITWHLYLFHDVYFEMGAFTREEPIVALGILSIIIQGAVIGFLFQFYYKGVSPIKEGIKFMFIAGMLIYSVMGFATVAKFDINPITKFLLYHTVFQSLQFIIAGVALGLVYRKAR